MRSWHCLDIAYRFTGHISQRFFLEPHAIFRPEIYTPFEPSNTHWLAGTCWIVSGIRGGLRNHHLHGEHVALLLLVHQARRIRRYAGEYLSAPIWTFRWGGLLLC